LQPIILTAVVDEKRRIMIDLPDDVPLGEVEFLLLAMHQRDTAELTRESLRARMIAAGHRSNLYQAPDDMEISEDELERIGKKLVQGKSLSEHTAASAEGLPVDDPSAHP
jgi:hypothetical protein